MANEIETVWMLPYLFCICKLYSNSPKRYEKNLNGNHAKNHEGNSEAVPTLTGCKWVRLIWKTIFSGSVWQR